MPIVLPTPDEFDRLSWRQRQRATALARGALAAWLGAEPPPAEVLVEVQVCPSCRAHAAETRRRPTYDPTPDLAAAIHALAEAMGVARAS